MTNTTALDKRSLFSARTLHNGKSVVSNNRKLFIVLLVLHLTGMPLILLAMLLQLATHDHPDPDVYTVIAGFTSAIAGLAGIACALTAMPYLYRKTSVDMRFSLPMTTDQRFISDFFAGLFTYTVPYLISQCISLLLLLTGHLMYDGRIAGEWITYSTSKEVLNHFGEMAPYLFKLIPGYFMMMLMYYTLSVLVMTCCGSILENIMYSALINMLIPGAIVTATSALCDKVQGLSADFYIEYLLPVSSPTGLLYYLIENLDSNDAVMGFGRCMGLSLLMTLVYGVASFLIYRHRKAEDTGKPIVYDLFYFAMTSLTVAVLCFVFLMIDEDYIIPMIILTAIFYFVAAVIRNRGFKKFGRYAVAYLITMVVSCSVYGLMIATNGFGAATRVPAPMTVSKVYISYNGIYGKNTDNYNFLHDLDNSTVITDRDSISVITDIHRQAVNPVIDETTPTRSVKEINVLYKMRTGSWMYRTLRMNDDVYQKLSVIDMTDEMKTRRADLVRTKLIKLQQDLAERPAKSTFYMELKPVWVYDYSTSSSNPGQYSVNVKDLPASFYEDLADAYRADIMAQDEETYLRPDLKCGYLSWESWENNSIYLDESFVNTLSYLKSAGFPDIPEVSEYNAGKMANDLGITMISAEMYEHATGKDISMSSSDSSLTYRYNLPFAGERRYNYGESSVEIRDNQEGMLTLLRNSRDHYYSDDVNYLLSYNGYTSAIPPEYNDIADRIFIRTYITGLFRDQYDDIPNSVYNEDNLRIFLEVYGDRIKEYNGEESYKVVESAIEAFRTYQYEE